MLDEQARAKGAAALAEYREKLKSGEIVRTKPLNPEEKSKANPKSMKCAIAAKCWDCSLYNFRPYR